MDSRQPVALMPLGMAVAEQVDIDRELGHENGPENGYMPKMSSSIVAVGAVVVVVVVVGVALPVHKTPQNHLQPHRHNVAASHG